MKRWRAALSRERFCVVTVWEVAKQYKTQLTLEWMAKFMTWHRRRDKINLFNIRTAWFFLGRTLVQFLMHDTEVPNSLDIQRLQEELLQIHEEGLGMLQGKEC